MNVSLTPALEKMIHKKVKSGAYNNASEVVREALRLLEEQDRIKALHLERLKNELRVGIEELDRGEGSDLSFDQIHQEVKARK